MSTFYAAGWEGESLWLSRFCFTFYLPWKNDAKNSNKLFTRFAQSCVYIQSQVLPNTHTPERRWHGYERERGWILPQTSQQQSDSGWYKEGRQQNTQSQTGLQEIPPRSDQTYSTDKALLILLFFFCFPSQLCSPSSKTFEPSREVSLTQIVAGAPWCLLPYSFLLLSTFTNKLSILSQKQFTIGMMKE